MKKFTVKPRVFRSSPGYAGTPHYESKSWVYLGRLGEAGPLTDVRFDTDMAHVDCAVSENVGRGNPIRLAPCSKGFARERQNRRSRTTPGKRHCCSSIPSAFSSG